MNITTFKPVLLSSILGLAMSATVATTAVNAAEDILNDAIHDYSGDAWNSNEYIATNDGDVYLTSNILNDATHDYVSEDVALFIDTNISGETDKAEFAAFEKAATPIPWEISSEKAW